MRRPLTRRALAAALAGAPLAPAARLVRDDIDARLGRDDFPRAIRAPTGRPVPAAAAAPAVTAQTEPANDRVAAVLAALPLADKVAQRFMVGVGGTALGPDDAAFLTETRPGGVILLGPNIGTPAEVAAFVAAIKATNPGLPPFVAVDQEGGPVARLPGDPAPGAVALGTLPDAEVRALAAERAAFVAGFGFDVNFAPVADVAFAPDSVMADRAFGSDPELVAAKVAAAVEGGRGAGVAHAAKHFPGHGRAALDSHLALPEIDLSLEEWRATDALPFRAAIEAGVEMVMLGHLRYTRWDDAPTSISAVAVDRLRTDLGFDGIVVTDDLGSGMAALAGYDPATIVARAAAAGVDLLLFATPTPSLAPAEPIDLLRRRVAAGEVSEERLDASVRRLLRRKLGR